MPTIICSYCEFVGQGDDFEDRIKDIEEHEVNCDVRLALISHKEDDVDEAYEQARADNCMTFEK